mmetsp:Transcript_4333/g.19624  ORF Transcript_4333/g.19624 Transcript_4333/m.19624 type:complete len:297 (-) Transcript_4333:1456-2346(-)
MEAGDPRLPARAAPPRLPEPSPIDSPARPLTAYLDTKALACRVLLSPARYTRPSLWDIRASSSSSTSIARCLAAAAAALPGSREPGRRAGVAPADPCTDPRLDRLDADAGVNLAAGRALPEFAGRLSRGGEYKSVSEPPLLPPASRSLSIVPASIAAYRSMASSSTATFRRSRIMRTGLGVGANDISRGGPGADRAFDVDRRAALSTSGNSVWISSRSSRWTASSSAMRPCSSAILAASGEGVDSAAAAAATSPALAVTSRAFAAFVASSTASAKRSRGRRCGCGGGVGSGDTYVA